MNIALIGSGGREHALCFKILKSPKVSKVFCIPGNAGTSKIATNLQIDYLNFGFGILAHLLPYQRKSLRGYLLIGQFLG